VVVGDVVEVDAVVVLVAEVEVIGDRAAGACGVVVVPAVAPSAPQTTNAAAPTRRPPRRMARYLR
jgi:hypothetical protein